MELFPTRIPWWTLFLLLQNLAMASAGAFSHGGLGVTWSLAIEEQFYLTLPLVIRRLTSRFLVYVLAAAIVAAFLFRAWLIHLGPHSAFAAYVLTPSRADALAIGVLCALWVRSEGGWNSLVAHRRWLYAAFVALALGLLLLLSKGYGFYDRTFHGVDPCLPAFMPQPCS